MKVLWMVLCAGLACAGCKKSEMGAKSSSGESSSESAVADDGAAVALQAKWPVGNRYAQRLEMNGDTETFMSSSPKPMAQKVNLNQEYSIMVLAERPKGGRELELEFEATEIDVNVNGKPVLNMDTKAEAGPAESNPAVAGFRQVIGSKIKFLLDESNRVEKVEGIKEFAAKASAGSNPQGRAMVQSMFSEDYFKQMVDFQRALPTKPVRVGESWPLKTDLNLPALGLVNLEMNYTFKGWEQREKRKCATIDFTGTMSSRASAAAPGAGMSMNIQSGKLSGKTWFDPELGYPIETAMNQDLIMHMTVPIPRARNTNTAAQTPGTQSITNNTKQKVVIKLEDVVSAAK